MKAIMISIRPQWVEKILNGEKTIEIRKTIPKCDLPIEVYIYCTSHKNYTESLYEIETYKKKRRFDVDVYRPSEPDFILNGKVVAKFTLNKVEYIRHLSYYPTDIDYDFETDNLSSTQLYEYSCVDKVDLLNYLLSSTGYAWHIDDLVIFDRPKELSSFYHYVNRRDTVKGWSCEYEELNNAPQSWCFVEL